MSKETFLNLLIGLVLVATIGIAVWGFVLPHLDKQAAENPIPATTVEQSPTDILQTAPTPIPEVGFPDLDETQLVALLPAINDLPEAYRASASPPPEAVSLNDTFGEALSRKYGNYRDASTNYLTCQPGQLPIGAIEMVVDQFDTAAQARQFVDDPLLRASFGSLLFEPERLPQFYGWHFTFPELPFQENAQPGDCFARENLQAIAFEYWDFLFVAALIYDANADPAQVQAMFDSLSTTFVTHVNSLSATPLPATPVPPVQVGGITNTFTLSDLNTVLALSENDFGWGEGFVLNSQVSHSYTLAQFVQAYQALGLPDLARAIETAGTSSNMIGQEVRVWSPQENCPGTLGLSVEMDVALFQTSEGARTYMNDTGLQAAWRDTNMIESFTSLGDEILVRGSLANHHCGAVKIIEKMIPYERLLITVAITSYPDVDEGQILSIIDAGTFSLRAATNKYLVGP